MKLVQHLKEHLDIAEFKRYFNGIVTYQNPKKFIGQQL